MFASTSLPLSSTPAGGYRAYSTPLLSCVNEKPVNLACSSKSGSSSTAPVSASTRAKWPVTQSEPLAEVP